MIENNIIKYLRFRVYLFALLPALLITGCYEANDIEKPEKLIPDKALVSIISETSVADGILGVQNIRDLFFNKDSLYVYTGIINRYGYSKEEFDNTLNYYLAKKPKKLIKIYNEVLARVTELKVRIANEPVPEQIPESDVWQGQRKYYFPDIISPGDADFSIKVTPPGICIIKFQMTLYPGDQSKNPCFTGWYVNADSAGTGKKTYMEKIVYFRDGAPHIYTINENINANYPILIEGKLYDRENEPDENGEHALIRNITVTFTQRVL